jgi:hypothetical protein
LKTEVGERKGEVQPTAGVVVGRSKRVHSTIMAFASALQEQCLYGIDDDGFASYPAHSIYPPPFATDAAAGPFVAWAAQVKETRMRQLDSSKRIFDYAARVPMPPLKSYQVRWARVWWRILLTIVIVTLEASMRRSFSHRRICARLTSCHPNFLLPAISRAGVAFFISTRR